MEPGHLQTVFTSPSCNQLSTLQFTHTHTHTSCSQSLIVLLDLPQEYTQPPAGTSQIHFQYLWTHCSVHILPGLLPGDSGAQQGKQGEKLLNYKRPNKNCALGSPSAWSRLLSCSLRLFSPNPVSYPFAGVRPASQPEGLPANSWSLPTLSFAALSPVSLLYI